MAKFKPIRITDPAELNAAKDFALTVRRYHREKAAMMKRFQKEQEEFEQAFRKNFRDCYRRVTMNHLPDPDEAFNSNTHVVDAQYAMEHDVAFIVEVANADNPPDELSEMEEDIEDFPGSLVRMSTH